MLLDFLPDAFDVFPCTVSRAATGNSRNHHHRNEYKQNQSFYHNFAY